MTVADFTGRDLRRKKNAPCVGDRVEYRAAGAIVSGILAETWTSELTGELRARVVDSHADVSDLDAGKQLDYAKLHLPYGQCH